MYYLFGFLSLLALLLGVALSAHGGARLAARWLLSGEFRWFDGEPPRGPLWRSFAVRSLSSIAGLAASVTLLTVAFLVQGERMPTTTLDVLPAQLAGQGC